MHFRRVAGRHCAALTLDTTAIRYSHIYTARYAFACLLEAMLAHCSSRITRTKVDNFSALCTIAAGVAQIVVPSIVVLSGQRPEQSKRRTFRGTALNRERANNEMTKKFIKMIKSKLLCTCLQVSRRGLMRLHSLLFSLHYLSVVRLFLWV